jgi:hypothetical protein
MASISYTKNLDVLIEPEIGSGHLTQQNLRAETREAVPGRVRSDASHEETATTEHVVRRGSAGVSGPDLVPQLSVEDAK